MHTAATTARPARLPRFGTWLADLPALDAAMSAPALLPSSRCPCDLTAENRARLNPSLRPADSIRALAAGIMAHLAGHA